MRKIVSRLLLMPLAALVAMAVGAAANPPAVAQAQTQGVYLSTAVPGVVVDKGKQVTFSIDVNNKGASGQTVDLALVKAPDGWNPILKDRGFVVRSVWVDAGKSEAVDLQIKAPSEAKAQDYEFQLRASVGGVEISTLRLLVGIKDQPTQGTSFVVQYPTLKGKSGASFGFKAELHNDSEEDRTYGLSFKAPDGWDVSFKPSYEDKQISTVQVKTGASQNLDVSVTPPARVEAGDYPITLTASSQADKANTDLKVTITGSYQMDVSTRTGLFNTSATAGQDSPFYVTVTNTGSAPLQGVSLSSSKPDGWTVTFSPDKIDQLDPGAQREVTMTIKPSAKAIAGDYVLNLTTTHPQVSVNKDIRVTVETPTVWGWVGVIILVAVIGGLMVIYMKLGRR
ncbi:MAG TPA: NEW3 domain-containing protein [Chloroflexota bacterium]|nr:NEW3 domain-containing protein [Chloroflexota bacterium]